jgi:hypothetical protein
MAIMVYASIGGLTPKIKSDSKINKARGGPNSWARDYADSREVNAALLRFPVSGATRFAGFSTHWKLFAARQKAVCYSFSR